MEYKFIAEVISAYRITIPKNIRKLAGLKAGDLLEVEIRPVKEEA